VICRRPHCRCTRYGKMISSDVKSDVKGDQ
jgi:hypothetical protein